MKLLKPKDWKPIDGLMLEPTAEELVRSNGNVLVAAGPGSGKTEMLAQKVSFLLTTENGFNVRRILAISLKRDAAYNLLDRVAKRCDDEACRRFASRTYDAFAKNIVDRFRNVLPERMRPTRDYILVTSPRAAEALSARLGGRISSQVLDDDIGRADFSNWDSEPICKRLECLLHPESGERSIMSFMLMMRLAIYIVETASYVKEGMRCAYSHILLDEFQDTTDWQYRLVITCFGGYRQGVTAVGDLNQRIMGWAGAKKDVFDSFQRDFDAKRMSLCMNHRSLPNLVGLQRLVLAKLMNREAKIADSISTGEPLGEIKLFDLKNESEERKLLIEEIRSDIHNGISPREISILCRARVRDFLAPLKVDFEKSSLNVRDEAVFQDLLKGPIVKLLHGILELAFDRRQADLKKNILRMIADILSLDEENVMQRTRCVRLLNAVLKKIADIEADPNDGLKVEHFVHAVMESLDKESVKRSFVEYRYSDEAYDQDIQEYSNWMSLFTNQCNRSLKGAMRKFKGDDVIPLMTIHKSKGLEYKSVYFLGLEDRKFWGFRQNPDEEMCAIYVAMSRAKQKLSFSFCKTRDMQWQSHDEIDGFFSLLKNSPLVEVVSGTGKSMFSGRM